MVVDITALIQQIRTARQNIATLKNSLIAARRKALEEALKNVTDQINKLQTTAAGGAAITIPATSPAVMRALPAAVSAPLPATGQVAAAPSQPATPTKPAPFQAGSVGGQSDGVVLLESPAGWKSRVEWETPEMPRQTFHSKPTLAAGEKFAVIVSDTGTFINANTVKYPNNVNLGQRSQPTSWFVIPETSTTEAAVVAPISTVSDVEITLLSSITQLPISKADIEMLGKRQTTDGAGFTKFEGVPGNLSAVVNVYIPGTAGMIKFTTALDLKTGLQKFKIYSGIFGIAKIEAV